MNPVKTIVYIDRIKINCLLWSKQFWANLIRARKGGLACETYWQVKRIKIETFHAISSFE